MSPRLLGCFLLATTAAAACGGPSGGDDDVTLDTVDAPLSVDGGPDNDVDAAIDAAVATGDQCSDAVSIVPPGGVGATRVFSSTATYADDYDIRSCGDHAATHGPDRVFHVNVAAGHRLVATVKGVSSTFDPAIYLVKGPAEACAAEPHTCLAAADVGPNGDYERVMYRNTAATAVDVYIVVDGVHADGGDFRLDVNVDAIPPPPPGDTCAMAEPISLVSGRATVRGTASLFQGYMNDFAPGCMPTTERGDDHVYAVTVPPGKRVEATLAPKYSAVMYFLAGSAATCGTTCLGGAAGLPDQPAVVSYENATSEPFEMLVVVDSSRELTGGEYELAFTVSQ
jgi:hypothetical protein